MIKSNNILEYACSRDIYEYTGRKRSVAIIMITTLQPVCILLMDVGVCVRVKATHAEDDPAVESRAAVLCGNARRHLGLSILLPTLRPRPLQPHRPSTVVRSPSLPPVQSSFFSALPSLHVRSTSRAHFSSAFVPSGFLSSGKLVRARVSIVNVFCCAIFVRFLSVN